MSQYSPPPPYRSAPSNGFIGGLNERSPLVPVVVRKQQRDNEVRLLFLSILALIAVLSAVAIGGSIHLYNDGDRLPSLQREIDRQKQKHIRDLKDMDEECRQRIVEEDKALDERKQRHIRDLKDMDDNRRQRIEKEDKEIERRRARQTQEIQWRLDELRRDAERRAAAKLYWGDLIRDETCSAWKERPFSARLINLPNGVDGVSWCLSTSVDIFGTTYPTPAHCSLDREGRVFGHWIVKNDPTCRTYWENHRDMGCHEGARLIEAKLANHQPGYSTWREMCLSTPSHFNHADQGTPQICFVTRNDGIHGSWFIQDEECS